MHNQEKVTDYGIAYDLAIQDAVRQLEERAVAYEGAARECTQKTTADFAAGRAAGCRAAIAALRALLPTMTEEPA